MWKAYMIQKAGDKKVHSMTLVLSSTHPTIAERDRLQWEGFFVFVQHTPHRQWPMDAFCLCKLADRR